MGGGGGGAGGGGAVIFGCDEFDTTNSNSFCGQIVLPIVNGTFTLANWNSYFPPTVSYQFSGGDGSILEQQEEAAAIQLGELQCAGEDPSAIAQCIQDAYDTIQPKLDPNGNPQMVGGNYDFLTSSVQISGQGINPSSFGCFDSRCGTFNSLDFSHDDGTFHVDTANVWSMFGIGALVHFGADIIGGNTWWRNSGIPRW